MILLWFIYCVVNKCRKYYLALLWLWSCLCLYRCFFVQKEPTIWSTASGSRPILHLQFVFVDVGWRRINIYYYYYCHSIPTIKDDSSCTSYSSSGRWWRRRYYRTIHGGGGNIRKIHFSTTPFSTVSLQYLVVIPRTVVPSKSLMLKPYLNWNDFRDYGIVNANANGSVDIIKYWWVVLILFVYIIIIIISWKIKFTATTIATVPLCKFSGCLRRRRNRPYPIVLEKKTKTKKIENNRTEKYELTQKLVAKYELIEKFKHKIVPRKKKKSNQIILEIGRKVSFVFDRGAYLLVSIKVHIFRFR